jgi:hypothetical protein
MLQAAPFMRNRIEIEWSGGATGRAEYRRSEPAVAGDSDTETATTTASYASSTSSSSSSHSSRSSSSSSSSSSGSSSNSNGSSSNSNGSSSQNKIITRVGIDVGADSAFRKLPSSLVQTEVLRRLCLLVINSNSDNDNHSSHSSNNNEEEATNSSDDDDISSGTFTGIHTSTSTSSSASSSDAITYDTTRRLLSLALEGLTSGQRQKSLHIDAAHMAVKIGRRLMIERRQEVINSRQPRDRSAALRNERSLPIPGSFLRWR